MMTTFERRQHILLQLRKQHPGFVVFQGAEKLAAQSALADAGRRSAESALTTDRAIEMDARGLPTTFVPGRNLVFLTVASNVLASSLDYEATLDAVPRLAIPRLGVWCALALFAAAEAAREKLVGQRQPLVTYPGDIYTLVYELPGEATEYELFLDTRGYYLEWMREEWLAETSRARAAGMLLDPAGSLKRLAPQFKKVEAQMDSMFWRSKYVAR